MDFTEKTILEQEIYNGKILNLYNNKVSLPDNRTSYREVVVHNGGSAVLCEKDDKVLFVKQYRYAVKEELLELPAGKLEKGEDPKVTAIRELEEEGGLLASDAELIYRTYPTPGYSSEIIYIYKVTDYKETKAHLDENEFLSAFWLTKAEIIEALRTNRIKDGKTIIGVQHYLLEKLK